MTKAIWKYVLAGSGGGCRVRMAKGALVLRAQNQHEVLVVWAIVDPNAESVIRRFEIVQTGAWFEPDPRWPFVGTVQFTNGEYVVHVFDCGEED